MRPSCQRVWEIFTIGKTPETDTKNVQKRIDHANTYEVVLTNILRYKHGYSTSMT